MPDPTIIIPDINSDTESFIKTKADEIAYDEGCRYVDEKAQHVIDFFETYLHHSKGEWAGKKFILQEWQKQDIIRPLFGWIRPNGTRRFRIAYIEIPKKNGKSTMVSGLALYMLMADREQGAEVYSAATARKQASIVFREAANMAEGSPDLKQRLIITRSQKYISFPQTKSFYQAIASDAGTIEGINISALFFDEKHALKNRDFWDAMRFGGAARRQPLLCTITTSGYDRSSICWESHEYAEGVIDGTITDTRFFPYIRTLGKDKDGEYHDWTKKESWYEANPSLGETINIEDYEAECIEAQTSITKENIFKRYRLNVWTEQYVRWIKMPNWEKCISEFQKEDLIGRSCIGAIDLGATSDLTTLCLLFPEEIGFKAIWWFWCPREKAKIRQKRDRALYIDWEKQGYIEFTEGDEIDYDFIRKRINEIGDKYGIIELAADRLFQGAQLCQGLKKDGFEVIPFGMGFFSLAAPTKEFEQLINRGEFLHTGNPVMRWMIGNVSVELDSIGNMKPNRKKSKEKIDGVVAGIMALGRALVTPSEFQSVYSERGIEVV